MDYVIYGWFSRRLTSDLTAVNTYMTTEGYYVRKSKFSNFMLGIKFRSFDRKMIQRDLTLAMLVTWMNPQEIVATVKGKNNLPNRLL